LSPQTYFRFAGGWLMDETVQLAKDESFLPFSSNRVIFRLDEPALMASMIWDESAMACPAVGW